MKERAKEALAVGILSGIFMFVLSMILHIFYPPYDIGFVLGGTTGVFVGNFLIILLVRRTL